MKPKSIPFPEPGKNTPITLEEAFGKAIERIKILEEHNVKLKEHLS